MNTNSLKFRQNFMFGLVAVGMGLAFTSCVKYNPKPLRKIKQENSDYEVTQENVTIRVKKLDRHACKKLFDGREKSLLSTRKNRRTYPIQVIVENNSSKSWVMSPEQINLELTPHKHIYQKMRTSTGWRVAGGVLGGLFGFNALAAASAKSHSPAGVAVASLGQLAVLIGAPIATYNSATSSKEANAELKDDLKKKTLHKDEVIKSGHFMRKLIFVKHKQFDTPFIITLENERNSTDMLRFVIDL